MYDFLGLLYFFIVLLYICVVSCPYVIYFPTFMAQYSLFVLKMLLNPKQTNLFIHSFIHHLLRQLAATYKYTVKYILWCVCVSLVLICCIFTLVLEVLINVILYSLMYFNGRVVLAMLLQSCDTDANCA